MQSNVDPGSGTPRSNEESPHAKQAPTDGAFGLDGVLLDRGDGFPRRLERRLRRQSELYGPDAARSYLAGLLELDVEPADLDAEAERILGVAPGSLRLWIDGDG